MTTLIERFEDKYVPEPMSGCWLWIAALTGGYGSFWDGEKRLRAHRWAYGHFIAPIPDNLCVCHRCDVRSCVNPDHLFLGAPADNTADMIKKGRSIAARHPEILQQNGKKNTWSRGANNPNVKLTQEQVDSIRIDPASFEALAKVYNVNPSTIQFIRNGKRWLETGERQ